MDKPRWLVTYIIGFSVGEIIVFHLKIHSLLWWGAIIAGPAAAMLIEDFRNRRQNNRWRAW